MSEIKEVLGQHEKLVAADKVDHTRQGAPISVDRSFSTFDGAFGAALDARDAFAKQKKAVLAVLAEGQKEALSEQEPNDQETDEEPGDEELGVEVSTEPPVLKCVCSKCGYEMPLEDGASCEGVVCPKCGEAMVPSYEEEPVEGAVNEDDDTSERPPCKLIGTDGNVFSIIGQVRRSLMNAGQEDQAEEFTTRAFASQSYKEVLALCAKYVKIESIQGAVNEELGEEKVEEIFIRPFDPDWKKFKRKKKWQKMMKRASKLMGPGFKYPEEPPEYEFPMKPNRERQEKAWNRFDRVVDRILSELAVKKEEAGIALESVNVGKSSLK